MNLNSNMWYNAGTKEVIIVNRTFLICSRRGHFYFAPTYFFQQAVSYVNLDCLGFVQRRLNYILILGMKSSNFLKHKWMTNAEAACEVAVRSQIMPALEAMVRNIGLLKLHPKFDL